MTVRPVAEIFETLEYGPAPESATLAHEWLERHGRDFGLFIDNQWLPASGKSFETEDPATGKPLANIGNASREDVDRAVAAARQAFVTWSKTPGHVRARYLYALAREVQKNSRLFAVLESLDNGKPIRESRDIDIPLVARHFYHHAGWAQLMEKELPGYTAVAQPLGARADVGAGDADGDRVAALDAEHVREEAREARVDAGDDAEVAVRDERPGVAVRHHVLAVRLEELVEQGHRGRR